MKLVISRIDIFIAIHEVFGADSDDEVPKLMQELHEDVDAVTRKEGFHRIRELDDDPSRRNGGWAYYDSYILKASDKKVKLLINVRSANHGSKPNLEIKNAKRREALRSTDLKKVSEECDFEDDNIEVLDTYYQERNWGAQYYIGKGDCYSDPVDSLEKFNIMLEGQLEKLKSEYM